MNKGPLLLLIILLSACPHPSGLFAQRQGQLLVDSLLPLIARSREDTTKVIRLHRCAVGYLQMQNLDGASKYASQALEVSVKLGFAKGEGLAYDVLGEVEYYQQKHQRSLYYFNKSLEAMQRARSKEGIAYAYRQLGWANEDLQKDSVAIYYWKLSLQTFGEIHNNLGSAIAAQHLFHIYHHNKNYIVADKYADEALRYYKAQGNKAQIARFYFDLSGRHNEIGVYNKGIEEAFTALKLFEDLKDTSSISEVFQFIGADYYYLGNFDEAMSYFMKALKLRLAVNDLQGMAQSYSSIARIYTLKGHYDEAFSYHRKAFDLYQSPNMPSSGVPFALGGMASVEEYKGDNYLGQNQKDSAIKYYKRAIADFIQTFSLWDAAGMPEGKAENYVGTARLYVKIGDRRSAKQYLRKALEIYTNYPPSSAKSEAYKLLSEINESEGDHQTALENYRIYIRYRDSLNQQEQSKAALKTEMNYEFDKKETSIKAEQERKRAVVEKALQRQTLVRNTFIGGFAVVLLFAGVFFSQRNKISKGKKLSDNLLLNILPYDVAEELKAKGNAEAKLFDHVTVLFTDFVNFTTTSEKLTPQELVNELHNCFKAFDEIISKYNIEKIKTIGDAYLAVSGLPHPVEQHAENVVNAALEIRDFMVKRGEELGDRTFGIRLGVHSGAVVAGIVGVKKFAYDIWGDTVNTAARMEQNSERGKLNISEATYELVKDKFACTYRGEIAAKNKGELKMYFVDDAAAGSLS